MVARFTPLRFVSAFGPNIGTVEFRTSTPNFLAALAAKHDLDATLDGDVTTVIYRLFYDSDADKFYSSRQFYLDSKPGGDELYAGEPQGFPALAYELFTAPKSLLSPSPNKAELLLKEQVMDIFTHSNTHRPGGVEP